jgi:pimeloyl-ACP methyl ester carboxylesterase
MKERALSINGIQHHIYTWGNPNSQPLFLIHGWMDSGLSFQFLAEELSTQYFCVAPDLRGFGKTQHTSDPTGYFYEQYICDIHDLFNIFAPNQKILTLGHSMGGNILTYYCGAFPDRVQAFINLEGLGTQENSVDKGPEFLRNWIVSRGKLTTRTYANTSTYKDKYRRRQPGVTERTLDLIIDGLLTKLPGSSQWTLRADLKHFMPSPVPFSAKELTPFLKRIQARCLFFVGTKSHYLNYIKSPRFIRLYLNWRLRHLSNVKLVFADGVGHMLHLEQPKKLIPMITSFLNDGSCP